MNAPISMAEGAPELFNVATFGVAPPSLFPFTGDAETIWARMNKSETRSPDQESKQGVAIGPKSHPFDFRAVTDLITANPHHSACVFAKVQSMVGVGFKSESEDGDSPVDKKLDPLCESSWQETFSDVIQDAVQIGNGVLEVVRRGEEITGLHHLAMPDAKIYIEDAHYNRHWEISAAGQPRRFACFGDRENFLTRRGAGEFPSHSNTEAEFVSEVIHFRTPTSLNRWYGFPDWLSAVPSIELVQCLQQHKYDFFWNRGVPEFMLFLLGQKLPPDDWDKIEKALLSNVGKGNSHKSLALNLASSEVTVELHKLAMDAKGETAYDKTKESLALDTVTAHRVPPLLAGIQIPGKLGATNELPNALMAFHVLVVGPAQRLIQQTLRRTLGGPKGVKGLDANALTLNKIIDELNLDMMATVGGMRQTVPEAQAQGRDLGAGMKD